MSEGVVLELMLKGEEKEGEEEEEEENIIKLFYKDSSVGGRSYRGLLGALNIAS